ncbi:SAC3/GANP/Nin1/mts3/eIF-3 p25 family-domain-containing protein [Dipodascopsis tothii]|uniref:SAC3/GANP/Nin1/mts3/eIF-3 p25 family-domain-containing protein n=1 Tax=Dipodascopsis tothii TaxID=44089 RepID=UPI0034CD51A8
MSLPPWKANAAGKGAAGNAAYRTAYTAVSTSKTLAGKTRAAGTARPAAKAGAGAAGTAGVAAAGPSAPAAEPAARKPGWPDSLKQFVGRCFTLTTPSQKETLEKKLKAIVTEAVQNNSLWTIDWDSYPIPEVDDGAGEDRLELLRKDKPAPPKPAPAAKPAKRSAKWDQGAPAAEAAPKSKKTRAAMAADGADSEAKRQMRLRRFEAQTPSRSVTPDYSHETNPNEPVVGRCTRLEKKYLRLTSAPDPETVRPLPVLRQTLELLRSKWKAEQNYAYICDQFKSMRQDLTVQLIQNEFTVSVYEIHARIALEKGDLGEYNQCQTQLRTLYEKGLAGSKNEFLAYRILYMLHTRNRSEMNEMLITLTADERADPAVAHALQVQRVMNESDYHSLHRLYLAAPNMGGYIMDSFIERERIAALAVICRAFRPEYPLQGITAELGLESDTACYDFLKKYGLHPYVNTSTLKLDTKEAYRIAEGHRLTAFKKIDIKGQI